MPSTPERAPSPSLPPRTTDDSDPEELREDPAASSPAEPPACDDARPSASTRFVLSRTVALSGLFVLALLYTAYFARGFLLPIVLALFLLALLRPLVRWLHRVLKVPEALGAGLVVLGLVLGVGYGVYRLALPAADWVATAPESLRRLEHRVRSWRKPVEDVSKAAESAADTVKKITSVEDPDAPQEVTIQDQSLTDLLIGKTTTVITQTVTMLILLYFLLASGDLFLRKLVRGLPRLRDKKRAVEIARTVSSEISLYLGTVTLVNIGLGVAIAIAMSLLGMPNPMLWGMLAGVTNYVPYLGGLFSIASIALVAFQYFPEPSQAVLPPLAYFVLNFIESEVVTPMVLGRRLSLNPVVIFTGLMFWGWIWGIPGAILAVPMLVVVKIACDHFAALQPIGELLGGAPKPNDAQASEDPDATPVPTRTYT